MSIEGTVLEVIRKKPEVKVILERALALEDSMKPDDLGFEWFEVGATPALLNRLCVDPQRILKITLKTHSSTHYRLLDIEATRTALDLLGEEAKIEAEKPSVIPPDLFDDVVGYEDVKELFMRGLEVGKVHFLLLGPPASAKTLFLLCLERLPKSRLVLGSRMSKAGLAEYLFTHQPKVLLLDEIDKLRGADYGVLLSLCETGRVSEMIYGKTREITLDTIVFACANRLKGIPEEVLSRFGGPLKFPPYTRDQFINVVENVLRRRGIEEDLALYIAKQVWDELESKDPRAAVRIARLAKTQAEVDRLVSIIKKYR